MNSLYFEILSTTDR